MIFDLHIHEKKNSSDSQLDIYRAIEVAKAKRIDGICITDHDSLGLKNEVYDIIQETDFKVIVGVEIFSLDGDLLCFGIDSLPEKRMSAQKTIEFVKSRGGVCIAAHPFRDNGRGLGFKIRELEGLDAIEVLNGRTKKMGNKLAIELAEELEIPMIAGSDAHTDDEVGNFVTHFDVPIETEQDLVEAIQNGKTFINEHRTEHTKIS